jgi:hypothetical protein
LAVVFSSPFYERREKMERPIFDATVKVNFDGETPFIETRARVIRGEDPSLPAGKIMVMRTPILPPGASDEEIREASTKEILEGERPGRSVSLPHR